jgi:hypothetical protein
MPSFAISPPAAHRTIGQVCIDGHDVNLCVTKKPVDDILPSGPQPGLDDDAQLDANGGWHQPGEGILKVGGEFFATWLAQDDCYGRRGVDDKAAPFRPGQRGRPTSS